MSAKFPRGGGAGPFLARSLNSTQFFRFAVCLFDLVLVHDNMMTHCLNVLYRCMKFH